MSKEDWAGASLPEMWVSAEAADTEMAWQQVSAWQRTYELLLHHELRLEACRDGLTVAWPPERSPAATAFVDYIDGLLEAIRQAKEEAVANHRALGGVLGSLAATKADMAKLKAEWDAHEAQSEDRPRNFSRAYPYIAGAETRRREELNERARKRMAQNDQEMLEATRQMVELTPPDDRVRGPQGQDPARDQNSKGAGNTATGTRPQSASVTVPTVRSPAEIDSGLGLAGSLGAGSSAGGVPTGTVSQFTDHRGASPSGQFGPGLPAATGHGPVIGNPAPNRSAIGAGRAFAGGGDVAARNIGRVGSPLSPTGGHQENPRKVNPVGGLIGQEQRAAGTAGMPIGGMRPGGTRESSTGDVLDLLRWEVAEGGPSVIEPSDDSPFILGPGVIGIDR